MPHFLRHMWKVYAIIQKAIANLLPDRRSRTSTNALHAVRIAQLQRCKISNYLLTLHFSSVVNQNTQPFISFQRCATHLKIARWLAYVVDYLGTAPRSCAVRFGFKRNRNFSMPLSGRQRRHCPYNSHYKTRVAVNMRNFFSAERGVVGG